MHSREFIIIAVSAVVVAAVFGLVKPIPQDKRYHLFADTRTMLGVPNFMDVASNIFFVIAGIFGLYAVFMGWGRMGLPSAISYLVFFAGVFLTGFGSGWYHLKPDNESLVWDRLPMTISFAGLFSSVVAEVSSPRVGVALLLPLLALGIFSVIYWIRGERRGRGDLRLYAIVQFLPFLLIPLIIYMYGGERDYIMRLTGLVLFYVLAKVFEFMDGIIYSAGHIVSGHTLKHISASAGIVYLAFMFL